MRRLFPLVLAFILGAGVPRVAADVEWTLIDVKAYLEASGRLRVVETHHMRVEKGGFSLFREFGLGADQAIAFKSLTRVDADGSEHPLQDAEVGEDPGRYRYYDRGHAYYRLPELKDGGTLSFRFEYELVNAMAPAWGIGAGPGPLLEEPGFVKPWQRLGQILADWRDARPDPARRFRLEHDVLLPSREGPGYKVREVNYRLEYETGWKRVRPDEVLAIVKPDDHYRVRVLFEYLPPGQPPSASWRESATRLSAVAALPVLGALLWLFVLAVEGLGARGSGPEPDLVAEHLLPLAPEQVALWAGDSSRVDAQGVLSRLASERKIALEFQPTAGDEDGTPQVRMRLLVHPASLPAFEREVLAPFFPEGQETSSERLREAYKDVGFDPDEVVARALGTAAPPSPRSRWSLAHLLLVPLGLLGVVLQFRALNHLDLVPLIAIANGVALILTRAWPKAWWCTGRPKRGLLVFLVLMIAGYLTLHLVPNRPLPVQAWVGGTLVALACYGATLVGSRIPAGGPYTRLRHFTRIRRFAAAELRRPNPRLEDAWVSRLQALGLRREIERWKARFGGAGQLAPDLSAAGAEEAPSGPRFTGRVPEPFVGPYGWTDALRVYVEDDEEDGDEDRAPR